MCSSMIFLFALPIILQQSLFSNSAADFFSKTYPKAKEVSNKSQVLVIPFLNASHTLMLAAVADALASRGHSVSVLWPSTCKCASITSNPSFHLFEYNLFTPNGGGQLSWLEMSEKVFLEEQEALGSTSWWVTLNKVIKSGNNMFTVLSDIAHTVCRALLSDVRLIERLREKHFSMAIVDSYPSFRCTHLLPKMLGVPMVSVGELQSPWDMRIPWLVGLTDWLQRPVAPMVAGQPGTGVAPSFWERARGLGVNLLAQTVFEALIPPLPDDLRLIAHVSDEDFIKLGESAVLYLWYYEPLMIGVHPPLLPHVRLIGGITASPQRPVADPQLLEWADAAKDGFVLCSFGSVVSRLSKANTNKLFRLFEALRLPVVARLQPEAANSGLKVPPHVRLADWLPQQELLAHPNARLFITHGGSNGVSEALFHGVPMFVLPFISGQALIGSRVEALGFGRWANLEASNAQELRDAVSDILENETKYRDVLRRISKILRARQHPRDVAADAVELILQSDDPDFLKPKGALSLNRVQYYMLDVALVFFLLISMATLIFLYILRRCVKAVLMCMRKTGKRITRPKTD